MYVHTAGGERMNVAGSHSFSMWAGAARCILHDESAKVSWNQLNFMVMSYDAIGRQPIGM